MNLWDLLEDEEKEPEKVKEDKKETEQVADQQPALVAEVEKQATVQATEVETAEKPKKEGKPAGKKKSVKETKKSKTLEEQIATVPDNLKTPIDRIFKYLMSVPGMDEKMRDPKKSITDMWQFVEANARKQATGNTACIEDEVVYGWAVHYYDEDDPK